MGTESGYYKEIISKLNNLTKKEYTYFASLGIQFALITGVSVFFIFSLLEIFARFSVTGRTILFFVFILTSLGSLFYFFLRPAAGYLNLFVKKDHFKTAQKVGNYFPAIKDELLNAMQLVTFAETKNRYSPVLIDAAFRQVYNKTHFIEFETIVSFKKSRTLLLYTIGIIVFISSMFLFIPGLQAASNRLMNFNSEFVPPAKFSFIVEPGNTSITKGEDVFISVKIVLNNAIPGLNNNSMPVDVKIAVKSEEQTEFEYKSLTPDSTGIYRYSITAVRNSFRYFIKAEDVLSDEYAVNVIDRPVIKNLELTITSPAYSGIQQVNQKDNGNVTALLGSNISIKLNSTKELGKAIVEFDDTTMVELKTNYASAEGNIRVKGDNNYRIKLKDKNGNENLSPITYTIKALYDAYPAIDMISPNKDVNLSNDNRVPLFLKISDDYGFSKLVIHYRLSSSKYSEINNNEFSVLDIPINKNNKESEVNYIWNLSRMSLGVEDVITYYLEVFDNDNISGPKSTKTPTYNVRVPALEEILAKAENTQQKAEVDMKEVLKEAEELKKSLEKIDQELKKDQKDITWEEKEKIEKSLEKFDELQQKMDKVSDELNKMQQDLQKNNLLSQETLEKYMELQKLMDQLSSEEMKKAMEKMQNMLQKMNRDQVQQEMQNLKVDEDAFKKSIERTMNLLKRIQVEQKVDELVKRSEEITEKQDKLREENSANQNDQKEQMQDKQNEVTKDLEKFEQEMKELAEKMDELKDLPKEELEKAMKEFEKQQNQEKSEKASQQMQKNQKQQAQQNQQQVSKNMKQMQNMMQQLQESMQQANQVQAFTDMMKIMDNILTLSKQQEQLKKETQKLEPNSSQMKENAQKQNNLQKNLQKIMQQMGDLSQKTFAVSPEMGKSLGDAMKQMQNSTQAMQNRNAPQSAMGQGESMKSLNEAASLMKGSMESMMQGGNGQGGMMSLMQQLQQLGQQQMNLNNMTQQLQQGNNGQLNPQQQAQLQKLTQQQELIKKSMEQLNREARQSGKSKSLPGNLENITKEMQEIVSGMRTEKLNDELIQKQEKILSRMLDAQRSINERDFEKQRESYTGENIARQSPGELKLNSAKAKDKIKDELNHAGQEGYSKDYEELIKKYFEALQKDSQQ